MFDMVMYADDTTLYCNMNQNIAVHEINFELEQKSIGYPQINYL